MVNSITCDTSFDSLIQKAEVNVYLNEIQNCIKEYMKRVNNVIEEEKADGGLSANSVSLSGSSISAADGALLATAADKFLADMKIEKVFNDYRAAVDEAYKTQKNRELNKLIEKIDEKLVKLKSEYKSANSDINYYSNKMDKGLDVNDNYISLYNEACARAKYLSYQIKKYEDKKQTAEGLII